MYTSMFWRNLLPPFPSVFCYENGGSISFEKFLPNDLITQHYIPEGN